MQPKPFQNPAKNAPEIHVMLRTPKHDFEQTLTHFSSFSPFSKRRTLPARAFQSDTNLSSFEKPDTNIICYLFTRLAHSWATVLPYFPALHPMWRPDIYPKFLDYLRLDLTDRINKSGLMLQLKHTSLSHCYTFE